MLRHRFLTLLCCALAAIAMPRTASCDHQLAPRDYRIVTANRKFVFVMLAPLYGGDLRHASRYQASGLYRNDGSAKPIWTVPWYAFRDEVDVSSDGVHLVRWERPFRLGGRGVTFYECGRPIRGYTAGYFVSDPLSYLDFGGGPPLWAKDRRFDDVRGRVSVIPAGKSRRCTFDITTGAIVLR